MYKVITSNEFDKKLEAFIQYKASTCIYKDT